MPLANLVVPTYPDVPIAAGVPPVPRQVGAIVDNVTALVADAVGIVQMLEGPSWGIFDQTGNPVLVGDSVVAVDYRHEWRVLSFPIEEGGFGSYNKVQSPFDFRVTFTCGGAQTLLSSLFSGGVLGSLLTGGDDAASARSAFLNQMEQAAASLYLFSVVTPEASYPSCNIVHVDYRREARKGATLITVEVWLTEVRVSAKATYSNGKATGTDSIDAPTAPAPGTGGAVTDPADPGATSPVDQGTTQTAPITATQSKALPAPEPANAAAGSPTSGTGGAVDVSGGSEIVVSGAHVDTGTEFSITNVRPSNVPTYTAGAYTGTAPPSALSASASP